VSAAAQNRWKVVGQLLRVCLGNRDADAVHVSNREVLLLGWPSTGVWVVRLDNRTVPWEGSNLTKLASTMDERCEALKQNGATLYKDPNDCDYVKSLLDGFGEHEEEDNSPYDQMSPG